MILDNFERDEYTVAAHLDHRNNSRENVHQGEMFSKMLA